MALSSWKSWLPLRFAGGKRQKTRRRTCKICPLVEALERRLVPVLAPSIYGTVWIDSNGDGNRDASENNLTGVTVQLFRREGDTDTLIATTTTGTGTGTNYGFSNISSGDYIVRVIPPSGFAFTVELNDSDVDPFTGESDVVAVWDIVNAGLIPPQTAVTGLIWNEVDPIV